MHIQVVIELAALLTGDGLPDRRHDERGGGGDAQQGTAGGHDARRFRRLWTRSAASIADRT